MESYSIVNAIYHKALLQSSQKRDILHHIRKNNLLILESDTEYENFCEILHNVMKINVEIFVNDALFAQCENDASNREMRLKITTATGNIKIILESIESCVPLPIPTVEKKKTILTVESVAPENQRKKRKNSEVIIPKTPHVDDFKQRKIVSQTPLLPNKPTHTVSFNPDVGPSMPPTFEQMRYTHNIPSNSVNLSDDENISDSEISNSSDDNIDYDIETKTDFVVADIDNLLTSNLIDDPPCEIDDDTREKLRIFLGAGFGVDLSDEQHNILVRDYINHVHKYGDYTCIVDKCQIQFKSFDARIDKVKSNGTSADIAHSAYIKSLEDQVRKEKLKKEEVAKEHDKLLTRMENGRKCYDKTFKDSSDIDDFMKNFLMHNSNECIKCPLHCFGEHLQKNLKGPLGRPGKSSEKKSSAQKKKNEKSSAKK